MQNSKTNVYLTFIPYSIFILLDMVTQLSKLVTMLLQLHNANSHEKIKHFYNLYLNTPPFHF